MKIIHLILAASLLLCSTTAAMEDLKPYGIQVIVWDTDGNREPNVPVTFAYGGMTKTLYTAEDGTTSFGTHNFGEVPDGAVIAVSCKYGVTAEAVNYEYGATGITFNEPSQSAAIAAFAAMGFAVIIALGGGRYYLKRKKKQHIQEDNMTKEETGEKSKLVRDFGVRALIATLSITGFILTTAIAVYQNNTEMIDPIVNWYMSLLTAIVVFYFAGSITRDSKQVMEGIGIVSNR